MAMRVDTTGEGRPRSSSWRARAKRELGRAEEVAVRRAAGRSQLGEIGTLLGVSKQAMHQRYGRRT